MNTGQNKSVVDQLFNAIDNKNYTIARYKLCRAIERAKETPKSQTKTTLDREGQA